MTASVQIRDGVLTIDGLDVNDDVTVSFLEQTQPAARAATVLDCLQLGARAFTFTADRTGALLLTETFKKESEATQVLLTHVSSAAQAAVAKSSENVEKAVADLLRGLSKDLNHTLDPANAESVIGRLRCTLLADCHQITAAARKDLDLSNPHSPLSALRADLEQRDERRHAALTSQLSVLLQQVAARTSASAERSKSTRKGGDFESATLDFLTTESAPRKDFVAFTGNEYGLDQKLVGDFVVELSPTDAHKTRIVVETKNAQRNGATERIRELVKAMSNRGATFGITVIATAGDVPRAILPVGDDKIIVHVQALPAGDGWDFMALGVALECARWKALMGRTQAGTLDVARLNGQVERAVAITNSFTDVKRRITAGKSHLDNIADCLDSIKCELIETLQSIATIVTAAHLVAKAA